MNYVKKFEYIEPSKMNDILYKNRLKFRVYGPPNGKENTNSFRQVCYIEDGRVDFKVTTYDTDVRKVVHYVCYKDGRNVIPSMCGLNAWVTFCKYYKIPVLIDGDTPQEIKDSFISASALIGYNKKYSGQRQKAWGYDFNGAYAYALSNYWMDTTVPPRHGIVKSYEIGFKSSVGVDGDLFLTLAHPGDRSDFIFKRQPVPDEVKQFVSVYIKRKENAKNPQDKKRAKDMINYLVGFLQLRNPYLRALIVCACNEYIYNLIDDNTLFWNTDSIVSRVRRPDIEENLGPCVGQWKLEHEGVVAYMGNAYQWNDDVPTYRGVPKNWFKKGFDLLKDPIPGINSNLWNFDKKRNRLVFNKEAIHVN